MSESSNNGGKEDDGAAFRSCLRGRISLPFVVACLVLQAQILLFIPRSTAPLKQQVHDLSSLTLRSVPGDPQVELKRNFNKQKRAVYEELGRAVTQKPPLRMYEETKGIHVLFGLSGNHPGFHSEFRVLLKSVLLNAPFYSNLTIHIIADQEATDYLDFSWNLTGLKDVPWWTDIDIRTYNVESQLETMQQYVQNATKRQMDTLHQVGAYFRILSHFVLPKEEVEWAFYMDTDVVMLGNLASVWNHIDEDAMITMSLNCSGVQLINIGKLPEFWNRVAKFNWMKEPNIRDQELVLRVKENFGNVTDLPPEWDLTLTRHWRGTKMPEGLLKLRPEAGIFHYNGGGKNQNAYWEGNPFIENRTGGWALAPNYYVNLPWGWARFMGRSVLEGAPEIHQKYIRIHEPTTAAQVVPAAATNIF